MSGRSGAAPWIPGRKKELAALGVAPKALTALGKITQASLKAMVTLLQPALLGDKGIDWVQERFSGRRGRTGGGLPAVVAPHKNCTEAMTILQKLVRNRPDDTLRELFPRYVRELRRSRHPAHVRRLPAIGLTSFSVVLDHVAEPRLKNPTIRFQPGDMEKRAAYAGRVINHPLTNSSAKLLAQLRRSIAADEYSYDHSVAVQRYCTGYVPREAAVTSELNWCGHAFSL